MDNILSRKSFTIIFFLLFLITIKSQSEEIVKYSRPLANTYLIYKTSISVLKDLTDVRDLLKDKSKTHRQPSARLEIICNSNIKGQMATNWNDSVINIDTTTTRIILSVDANLENETLFKVLIDKKIARKLSTLFEKQYDDTRVGGKDLYDVYTTVYENYPTDSSNKDWNYWIKKSSE